MWDANIDKQCRLADDNTDEAERKAEELRLNLESRAGREGGGCTDAGLREHHSRGGGGAKHGNDGGIGSVTFSWYNGIGQ